MRLDRIATAMTCLLVLALGCAACASTAPAQTSAQTPARMPAPTPHAQAAVWPVVRLTPAAGVPGDPATGQRRFVAAGCGGCHTLSGVSGATGVAGPILTNVVLRPTLAGETIPMSPEQLTRFLLAPASVKPGTAMPSVGLTEAEARDITAFLYSLPNTPP